MPAAASRPAPFSAQLADESDFEGFRSAARQALNEGRAPDDVVWSVAGSAAPDLLADTAPLATPASRPPDTHLLRVSRAFIALCEALVLHREPTRFTLMYRLLWRLQSEPGLHADPLDADMARARLMAHAVRRDIHKMRAFVRFRPVPQGAGEPLLHVAWFEPEHHIVDANAGFFMRRFAGMAWTILTPERCVRWDGAVLAFSPGANRHDAPSADSAEALWLTYYRSIFNPARLKLRAMENEMPRRYWRNLPEAELISGLALQAAQRTGAMVEQPTTLPRRRIPIAALAPRRPAPAPIEPNGLPAVETADIGTDISIHATTAAARAQRLAAQRDAAAGCRACPLGALASQTVWGEGPLGARLMLVGEQPGDREDLQGRPFVGPAGQLLMRALADLGWPRESVYLTNAVKHFKYEPRGRRRLHKTPVQQEANACAHWLESEIALVRPQALVALGATAARQLLGHPVAVTPERGQWHERRDGLRVLITLHPSALLRMERVQFDAAYTHWLADLRQGDAPA